MKIFLKFITLLLLVLTFQIPSSFGQDNIVKVIYFYPNDKTPQADIDATLNLKLKNAQAFFATVLVLHGYERKTFAVETDGNEQVVVHHVQGDFNDAYYHDDPFSKVTNELQDKFSSSDTLYYVAIDIDSEVLEVEFRGRDVEACGIASGNWGATPAQGNCFSYSVIAHELGHMFGLDHDAFSSGDTDQMINSSCSAAWLDVHPYFNGGNTDSGPTTVQMLPPELAPVEGKVRFSFEVRDPDGLHLIRLFIHELDSVVACKQIGEVESTIHIDTSYIAQDDPSADLTIMDKSGNYSSFSFDVNTADLLNSLERTDDDIPDETVPDDMPDETVPDDMPDETVPDDIPDETVPDETVPDDMPDETVPDDIPDETVPDDIPDETVPDETVPDETVPDDIPDETVPDETVPDDIPDETASNKLPTFTDGESAIRWVLETASIGTNIGRAITAYDIDNDTITYSISGYNDSDVITIDSNTGQLKTNGILDSNTKNIYVIEVTALDDRGGSATMSVTIHVAPAGGGNLVPELIPFRVSFSELMIYTEGGIHSLPQWMELYNGSQTEVNLKGWQLAIEARDLNGVQRHAIIALEELYIPPKETVLIVTSLARQKSNIIPDNRVYNFFEHHWQEFEQNQHRNMVIGFAGFSLKLTNTDGILVDSVGNLDGDHSTTDNPTWVIPSGTTREGERTSLMRRFEKETQEPLDGTDAKNWVRTVDFPLDVSTYWGSARDIGNPGYRGSGALPVTLSQFWAELTETGAVLTWTTESELENAGFYILRSETRNGPFKVVTQTMIQGAGTTGERNKYRWTDNAIKHDTRYYYRIVDVSFAGVQQKLATVGLRGLLSARNKELKKWADLKAPIIP